MGAQPADHTSHDQPLIPMPPIAEAPLRVAVRRLDPAAAVTYEQEFHAAWEEAIQSDSTLPMQNFLRRWATFVALHRHPERSARLHELEQAMEKTDDVNEVHVAAAEIGRMLTAAAVEVSAR